MCTRDEANWNMRKGILVPEFQLRSMAQTRAASKALRLAYGWIAVLAGYSATPFEEMTGDEYTGQPQQRPTTAQAQNIKQCPKCSKPMKLIPAGTSKKTGKSYSSFWACEDRDCKGSAKA